MSFFFEQVKLQTLSDDCDLKTEFKCKTGNVKYIPRSYVNNGNPDCSDKSDENVVINCYKYEFSCLYGFEKRDFRTISLQNRCLTLEMVADGNNDCELDEKTLVHNCSDPSLFLCLDKSRCLPNKFKCDGVQSCIDASDEIEQCEYPTMFRIYKFDNGEQVSVDHWLHLLQLDKKLQSIESF